MPKRSFLIAVTVLAGPAILFAPPSAAQGPPGPAWTVCELREDIPGGAQLAYQSLTRPGEAPRPHVAWSSAAASRLSLRVAYGRGPASAPTRVVALYNLGSERQSVGYKLVFDFNGAAQQTTLSLGPGVGTNLSGAFEARRNAGLTESFAHAQRVTATVYEGDRQIAQATFEFAPERREAGLAAFARRVQANDPSLCREMSSPPLPVPPVPR